MSDVVLARRYAKAFFDLAASQSKVVKFQDQLHWITQALELVPDLMTILCNERQPLSKRLAIVDQVSTQLQLDALTRNFWMVLVEKNRMDCWTSVIDAFGKMAGKAANVVQVEVTTAVPLTDTAIIEKLNQALAHVTKKNVDVQLAVNDALIGGAIVRIDDTIYDGSLATDLKRLRQKLNETLIA